MTRLACRYFCPLWALLGLLVLPVPAFAAPVVVESGWSLIRTIPFSYAQSARFNPVDGSLLVGRRGSTADGLYRLDSLGLETKLATGSNVAAVLVTSSGDAFFSEDYSGLIYRVKYKTSGASTWVNGFHSGDDDPVGMAVAPTGYTGPVLSAGQALVVDRGANGLDEVWSFSPAVAEGEALVHSDNGTLVDAVDVAISQTGIFVVDPADSAAGVIYTMGTGGVLSKLTTASAIDGPLGITLDPKGGDLLVLDQAKGRVVRVGPVSGTVSDVITGLTINTDGWAAIDVTADGTRLVVTAKDTLYVFARCGVSPAGSSGDCDGNGTLDACDQFAGSGKDCNDNDVLDVCDVAAGGASTDCDKNGIPDECPICSPVEAVFLMDTSTSMDDEATALCAKLAAMQKILASKGISLTASLYGITAAPGGAYSCLTSTVVSVYGTAVPGNPPAGLTTLADCPGGNEVGSEDWGRAVAVVAGKHAWGSGTVRLVVPIADEGPWCGDPVLDPGNDRDSVTHASTVAKAAGVIVSPITGSGSSAAVVKLASDLATATGGKTIASSNASQDMVTSVLAIIKSACNTFSDCNGNTIPDSCDLSSGKSKDCDKNGVPDECQTPTPCLTPDAGVPDSGAPDAGLADLSFPDLLAPDAPLPDLKLPDLALADKTPTDLKLPDLALADKTPALDAGPDKTPKADTLATADSRPDGLADVGSDKGTKPDTGGQAGDQLTLENPISQPDQGSAKDSGGSGGDSKASAGNDGGCDCRINPEKQDHLTALPWLLALALIRMKKRRRGAGTAMAGCMNPR